ncbi:MAG: hypothetical protein ACREHG_07510, partial [Candidatus Saccharimonadales bacterium]
DTLVAKPKIRETLRAHKKEAFLSRQLVETRQDVPVSVDMGSCKFGAYAPEKVKAAFNELGFMSLLSRIPGMV